jgi:hypothetical protein
MSYAIAVDIGGTFTDLVAFDHETQKVFYAKSPTTYDNLVEGIFDCFRKAKIKPAEAALVNHGTTLVINSLIQRKGAKTALVTFWRSRAAIGPIPSISTTSATSPWCRASCASRFPNGWGAREKWSRRSIRRR